MFGDGAIIAAGAVVVEYYRTNYERVPAEFIKKSLDAEQIEILLSLQWLNKADDKLYEIRDVFLGKRHWNRHLSV